MYKFACLMIVSILIIFAFNLTNSIDPEDIRDVPSETLGASRSINSKNPTDSKEIEEISSKYESIKPVKSTHEGSKTASPGKSKMALPGRILEWFRKRNSTKKPSNDKRKEYLPQYQYPTKEEPSLLGGHKTIEETVIEKEPTKTKEILIKPRIAPPKPPRILVRTFSDEPPQKETIKLRRAPTFQIRPKKLIQDNPRYGRYLRDELTSEKTDD